MDYYCCCVVAKSCLTLHPHRLQHARLPYPSPSPGACSNSCPLSQWCHPTISSSVIPFSFCPQSFLASGSVPMSQLFASDGHSIWASASVLPMDRLTSLFFCSPRDSQESSPASQFESINSLVLSLLQGFPDSSVGKESTCNEGDPSLNPGLEKGEATHSSILGLPLWLSW